MTEERGFKSGGDVDGLHEQVECAGGIIARTLQTKATTGHALRCSNVAGF